MSDAEIAQVQVKLCQIGSPLCGNRSSIGLNPVVPDGLPGAAADGTPARTITISDVARFLPAGVALHSEPDGWAVTGVPANFWVAVQPVTVSGELLGTTAQVRFTPYAYEFDYGDGLSTITDSGGSSWAALGQDELTATPTSHVYTQRADLRATVTVVYTAEYRVGGGAWIGIIGAVSGATPPQRVLVVNERTALTTPA